MLIKDLNFLKCLEEVSEDSNNITGGTATVTYSSSVYTSGNASASSSGHVTVSSNGANVSASYLNTADQNSVQAISKITATGDNTLAITKFKLIATPKYRFGSLSGLGFAS